MDNKIVYIITTYKCSACKCIETIIKSVQKDNPTFEIEVYDYADTPDFIKNMVRFGDFPTVIFYKNHIIKYMFQGTLSKKKVEQIINDINF